MAIAAYPYSTDDIARCVDRFRVTRPHVHCITNSVAQHFTANVILAAGGKASMTIASDEIVDFVQMADALLINLGTMDTERQKSCLLAIETANKDNKPWALDPVFVQASATRLQFAQQCLLTPPSLVRCNAPEALALFQTDEVTSGAKEYQTVIAMTGKRDFVTDGKISLSLNNGSEVMDRITAMGCALNALMVGFLAVEPNRVLASASALSFYNVCGEIAAANAKGPGTFVPYFLDALANTSSKLIASRVQLL